MQEFDLYNYWEICAKLGKTIQCGGHWLRILKPGRLNLRTGPDYTGACFELDGVRFQGDVEFHLITEDWYRHRHHLDRAYTGVVLHLVSDGQGQSVAPVTNTYLGEPIPTIALPVGKEASRFFVKRGGCSCVKNWLPARSLLEDLALKRFEQKMQRFVHLLAASSIPVILYRDMLRALGYHGNETAFAQLARLVPLSVIEELPMHPLAVFALYAGQAGFLDAVHETAFIRLLRRYFKQQESRLEGHKMEAYQWSFGGVRPANHPHFRLAGWSELIRQHGFVNFCQQIELIFAGRLAFKRLLRDITDLFLIPLSRYWSTHCALEVPAKFHARNYFSKARIAEFILNIMIPLEAAKANIAGSHGYVRYLRDFYLWLPKETIYPSLVKSFPQVHNYREPSPGQALNQGLLYLKEQYCSHDRCNSCPILDIAHEKD